MLVRVPHHQADARQGTELLGRALRITTGYEDSRVGILPMNTPDGGASVLIGGSGDGAGIQYHNFGLARRSGTGQSAVDQLALNRCAIGLGGAASEVLDKIGRHTFDYKCGLWANGSPLRRADTTRCVSEEPSLVRRILGRPSGRGGSAPLLEALAAKHWPALSRFEGNGGLLPASRAVGAGLDFGVAAGGSGRADVGGAFRLA